MIAEQDYSNLSRIPFEKLCMTLDEICSGFVCVLVDVGVHTVAIKRVSSPSERSDESRE